MRLKIISLLAPAILVMTTVFPLWSQQINYSPLIERDYGKGEIYRRHQDKKYVQAYSDYRNIPVYDPEVPEKNNTCKLPWNLELPLPENILNTVEDHLTVLPFKSKSKGEREYLTFTTFIPAYPDNMISEILNINLLGCHLTDKSGNPIELQSKVLLTNTPGSRPRLKDLNSIDLKIPLPKGISAKDIAAGYADFKLSVATDFDKILLDKKDCGKTFTLGGIQAQLIEMEHNRVHLMFPEDNGKDWHYIPCVGEQPVQPTYFSTTTYPEAFYHFSRKNLGLDYISFEKEYLTNASLQENTSDNRYIILHFGCNMTAMYAYVKKYTTIEKRVEIKSTGL